MKKNILPDMKEDFSKWYNQLIQKANLAENSAVKWCMTIKPYWFSIRENMKSIVDQMIKNTWHQNAYFPLFIPKSFFSKEASHVQWFAKECAVVTHHRLKVWDNWQIEVDEGAKLEEELIVRPTSETIIWDTYKNWINSYRDLPLLINQRANVVRREMRTRPFLRTTEFLRQEWHTAHSNSVEAENEAKKMINVYSDFFKNFLAINPIIWLKTENEKFAWAVKTFTIETMMQDWKALQAGTSHFLWQNFAKVFDVKFTNEENKQEYVWATSRWVSTRMMWWLIMSHSDNNWLVLPPAIAPIHVVIVPIFKTDEELEFIKKYLKPLFNRLDDIVLEFKSDYWLKINENEKFKKWIKIKLNYIFDIDKQKSPWWKFTDYELKWIPIRITVWARDIENWTCELYQRYNQTKENIKLEDVVINITRFLYKIQNNILTKNIEFIKNNVFFVSSYDELKKILDKGWFVLAFWDGTTETELKIKEETKATIRCIPLGSELLFLEKNIPNEWKCIYTWKDTDKLVIFARSY